MRTFAICLAAAMLGLPVSSGDAKLSVPSGGSSSQDTSIFRGQDLASLLKAPPKLLGALQRDSMTISARVGQVWAHGDFVDGRDAADWGRRLRQAGFQRAGRADFSPPDDRFTLIVDGIVLRDARAAAVGLAILQEVHVDYLGNNRLWAPPFGEPKLGRDAWGTHSVGSYDIVTAFGFRVGNAAFIVGVWGRTRPAPPTMNEVRAVALQVAARARERLLQTG